MDAYLALRLFCFFCFLDRPVQLEPIFPKLFRIKVVRLKEKREPVLSDWEWEDEELPF
jgi:hypothetical protein